MGKNNNLISLSTYRKKKLHSKDSRKAASDESLLFIEGEQQGQDSLEILEKGQSAQIYSIENYIQTRKKEDKKLEQTQEDISVRQNTQNNPVKILDFSDYRQKKQNDKNRFSRNVDFSQNSKLISIEDYRKKKQKKSSHVRQAFSYGGVVALTLLFTFIIFQKESGDQNSMLAINQQKTREEPKVERGIGSVKHPPQKENPDSNWKQVIKEKDFTKEEYYIGKKPASSEYKGF